MKDFKVYQVSESLNNIVRDASDVRQFINELSGDVVVFINGSALPILQLEVELPVIQAGSGTPSPQNPRPITGRDSCKVWIAPEYDPDLPPTFELAFPSTVWSGSVDLISGILTVRTTQKIFTGDASENWRAGSSQRAYITISPQAFYVRTSQNYIKSNILPSIAASASGGNKYSCFINATNEIGASVYGINTLNDFKQFLTDNPLQVIYTLYNFNTVQLQTQEINTLAGVNYIWSDAGNVKVKYRIH